MEITLKIDQLTTAEKIQVMEMIWEDLCKNEKDFSPPEWHKQILDEREQLVEEGKEKTIDWEQAKKEIRDSLS